MLAQAAYRCNAHARALQYYEGHVRKTEGGAYNPSAYKSATYTDEEVTFLQANHFPNTPHPIISQGQR